MNDQPESVGARSMSRRQALKRGAVVGGALVWTVPAVQAISMTSAHADYASAPPASSSRGRSVPNGGGIAPSGTQSGALASTGVGTPVVAAAAAGTGLLVTGAVVAAAVAKAPAAATVLGSLGSTGAAGGAAGSAGAGGAAGGGETGVLPPSA